MTDCVLKWADESKQEHPNPFISLPRVPCVGEHLYRKSTLHSITDVCWEIRRCGACLVLITIKEEPTND